MLFHFCLTQDIPWGSPGICRTPLLKPAEPVPRNPSGLRVDTDRLAPLWRAGNLDNKEKISLQNLFSVIHEFNDPEFRAQPRIKFRDTNFSFTLLTSLFQAKVFESGSPQMVVSRQKLPVRQTLSEFCTSFTEQTGSASMGWIFLSWISLFFACHK